jgi:hypothetical protein
MIEAIEINKNLYKLECINPTTGKVFKTGTAYSPGQAIRLANTWNKYYIVETMLSWLNQRMAALKIGKCTAQWEAAKDLSYDISACLNYSVGQIKLTIIRKENTIRFIAPEPKSDHYDYYQKTILDLVDFCKPGKGAEA